MQAPMLDLYVKNSMFFDNGSQAAWDDQSDTKEGTPSMNEGSFFSAEPTNSPMMGMNPMLTAALDLVTPKFAPLAGSPALVSANAAAPPAGGFFDASAQFIGAVGAEDWTAGWTAFPEN